MLGDALGGRMVGSLDAQNLQQEDLFYEDRFLESWAGSIITNPSTAIVELVANCWDAYATEVIINLPDSKSGKQFSISDNGKGMTRDEFDYIWRAMSYNRVAKGGTTTEPPPGVEGLPRNVFGKNGKGRFASFCLAKNYQITSIKDGQRFVYKVSRTPKKPLITELLEFVASGVEGHGTTITGEGEIPQINLPVKQVRELLGGAFLLTLLSKLSWMALPSHLLISASHPFLLWMLKCPVMGWSIYITLILARLTSLQNSMELLGGL